jgi:hypothetical protein
MELDFQAIFKELNGLGIDYLVVGGLDVEHLRMVLER